MLKRKRDMQCLKMEISGVLCTLRCAMRSSSCMYSRSFLFFSPVDVNYDSKLSF